MVWRLLKLTKPQIEINLLKVLIKNGTTTMLMVKRSLVSKPLTRTFTTLTIRDNKSEERFSTWGITTTLPTKTLVLSFVMPSTMINLLVVTVLSLKTSTTLAMTVPSRQVGLKLMATVIMVATILMTTHLKETSTQELSTLNSLAQMENS